MKHGLLGPLIFLLLCSSTAFGLGSVVKKVYNFFSFSVPWDHAQWFCRRRFTDLATIYTKSDTNSLNINEYESWIGLRRKQSHLSRDWVWSDGQYHSIDWQHRMENATGDCAMVNYGGTKIYIRRCHEPMFFICQKTSSPNDFEFIPVTKNWDEAEHYCKSRSSNLASFSTSYRDQVITEQEFPIWIGLHREGESWSWNSGVSEYRNWSPGEPSTGGNCGSISSMTKTMAPQNCNARFPFLCILDSVVLVKENKSWEEALEHCRGLRSPTNEDFRYDLLSLQPNDPHNFVMTKVMQADTEEVWTGLRFLAGEWLWVNGADMLYPNLPFCPTHWQHCGILSKSSTGSMEARDCSERKNFLCYSYTPQ